MDFQECKNLQKPPESRSCYKPCSVDCQVTEFSDWSDCSSEDDIQFRYRHIERFPKFGGKPCPDILREERACNAGELPSIKDKILYRWSTSPWNPCALLKMDAVCGTGFQTRNLSCVDESGYAVEMFHCLDLSPTTDVAELITKVPIIFRLCQIICHGGEPTCVHSAWTPWSTCTHRYKAKRVRTRELIETSASDPFCKDKFSLLEEEECPFLPEHIITPENSQFSCLLDKHNSASTAVNGEIISQTCGAGYRYRFGLQVKKDAVEPGLESDLCIIDCPLDCVMGEWTTWSDCDVPCGHGYRQRKRKILVQANEVGRMCPPTVNGTEIQTDVCEMPCSEYRWYATGWSSCDLQDRDFVHKKCGNGTQSRTVKCIRKLTETEVEPYYCDPVSKPDDRRSCRLYCPGECIVSEWVVWKPCTQPCHHGKSLEKRRTIIRRSTKPDECPELSKKEACDLNHNCFEYSWHLGDWGSCVLPEGALCGEGTQRRSLVCQRSDGRQVENMNCQKFEESPSLNHLLAKPCYLDCAIDCIVTEWGEWDSTQCRELCGRMGKMVRYRTVVQQGSEAGQPCPAEVKQQVPCPFKPCYHWKESPWSSCNLAGAICGYGVKRRLVRCLRYDGLQVDKVHCLASNLTFEPRGWLDPKWLALAHGKIEEEDCYVRCPGDCLVSDWSAWSHCQVNCHTGQRIGFRTSSRLILHQGSGLNCPIHMWRRRPCWTSKCPLFHWVYRNDSLECERFDGLIVKGGCKDAPRPCFPECTALSGGKCDTLNGTCYCKAKSGKIQPVHSAKTAKKECDVTPSKVLVLAPSKTSNHAATSSEIRLKYYPDDTQASFWMYAMISIGSAFVIFVVVTIYFMCRSSIRRRLVNVQRQGSVRRRGLASPEHNAVNNSYS